MHDISAMKGGPKVQKGKKNVDGKEASMKTCASSVIHKGTQTQKLGGRIAGADQVGKIPGSRLAPTQKT